MSRQEQIDEFLTKWDEMLAAANAIDGFKWKFSVSITTDNAIIEDRVKTINGINELFTKHHMGWTTSNS